MNYIDYVKNEMAVKVLQLLLLTHLPLLLQQQKAN
jgi:hypothetical protein